MSNIKIDLNHKVILVTGGTGSFGKAFIEYVLKNFKPKRLIIFSRDEQKQFDMQNSPVFKNKSCLRFFIGDVRDLNRLRMAMRGVDFVIHAAAMKHVHIAEYNPLECVHTNIIGAENVVTSAIECGVKKVIALSTDKAVNPINLYGASKLASDKVFIAANSLSGDLKTQFSVVRYGNVVGSRGSIIPFFLNIISEGGKTLPITDERMTRFWISVNQGVKFVLTSMNLMIGGEVFVPKIPSMSIVEIAKTLAPKAELDFIGIRPGEKLHEVMISKEDPSSVIEYNNCYIICPQYDETVEKHYVDLKGIILHSDFCYSSDQNNEWLDKESFTKLLSHG